MVGGRASRTGCAACCGRARPGPADPALAGVLDRRHYRNDIEPAAEVARRPGTSTGSAAPTARRRPRRTAEEVLPLCAPGSGTRVLPPGRGEGGTREGDGAFWGGVGVIGSSKVLIRDGGTGSCSIWAWISRGRRPVPRPVRAARTGTVGPAPGGRRPGHPRPVRPGRAGSPGDVLAEPGRADRRAFISHPHIDHVGLAGFVRPDVPVHASPEAIALLDALERGRGAAGTAGLRGAERPLAAGRLGDPRDRRADAVDASTSTTTCPGPAATASSRATACSLHGDFRFHGYHPDRSWGFADAVAGGDVLVTEAPP